MRSLVRTKVALDNLDLSKLHGLNKIKTAIRYSINETDFMKKKREKESSKALTERMRSIENLKSVMLYQLGSTLENDKGVSVTEIRLSIDRGFDSILDDVINSSDFLPYDIERVEENSDYLISFPDIPIVLEVRLRR